MQTIPPSSLPSARTSSSSGYGSCIDILRIAALAHLQLSYPLVPLDNIFLSRSYASPFRLFADIVMHWLTKYVNGP
ncbi:hypothetical protein PLICRDRAFT_54880 [Plicaturopsis crispa FD-325 SS-3]|nr:hypothetical protein PLICRDRAFT_54880 [Plicaturopsis crispa FD-325 SS-3]